MNRFWSTACGALFLYKQIVMRCNPLSRVAAEIDSIQDSIMRHMDAEGVDSISGTDWRVTYKAVNSTRLDTAALKKALPDVAARFTKETTVRRFCVA